MLISAGKIVGIDVLDHIIIGKPSQERPLFWISMREHGFFK